VTLFISHTACFDHKVPKGFTEHPDRLLAIANALAGDEFDALDQLDAPLMPLDTAANVHSSDYLDFLEQSRPREGMVQLTPDVVMSAGSWEAILRAMGGAVYAVDNVMQGRARNAFCATRPPGHHAETAQAMGFCFVNNVAIAARHAQTIHGLGRVAIVDFDVHHGNGTQEIFWSDDTVLFASTHQMPCYPGTGASSETGAGNIFNEPLEAGSDGVAMRLAFNEGIIPALHDFRPELILLSAGFDAHWQDPLGDLRWTEEDYDWITRQIMAVADEHCAGRIVSVLEGGYHLEALGSAVATHVRALMGNDNASQK
jgi:acetoin utilization deacetylase AcuC-like enzyme